MRSASVADSEEVKDRLADFADFIERNRKDLVKRAGQPIKRELRLLLKRIASVNEVLELAEDTSTKDE